MEPSAPCDHRFTGRAGSIANGAPRGARLRGQVIGALESGDSRSVAPLVQPVAGNAEPRPAAAHKPLLLPFDSGLAGALDHVRGWIGIGIRLADLLILGRLCWRRCGWSRRRERGLLLRSTGRHK